MVRELLLITTHLCSCSTSFLQLQMETTGTDNKAADLLAWLDHQNETDVMQSVLQQLQVEGPLHTAAAAPVRFQVDVTSLASTDASLAVELMQHPGQLEAQATTLINQQLAAMHITPTDSSDEVEQAPSVRVCLQMQQVPLPLLSVPQVMKQVVASSSSSASTGVCVSVLAVVTGISKPADVCLSQRFHCPSCGQLTDVLTSEACLPCCSVPKTEWLKEDVTGRLMVPTQQLWVSELSAATGRSTYGTSRPALQVQLPEHLVTRCTLGQPVHIIGHACAGAGGGLKVLANNLQPVLPHATWLLPPAVSAPLTAALQQEQPLHNMWELLTTALGYHTPLDPHLAVALLLSAAAVGISNSNSCQPKQVNVLVLHEAFSPSTPRLLREAAALLSPHSVSMPMQHAEHVTPITSSSGGREQSAKAVFASILHLANTGIAAADLSLMTGKCRLLLLDALRTRRTPAPKNMPPELLLPPVSATCWAAASWEEVCPAAGEGQAPTARGAARRTSAPDMATFHGFDVCVGDSAVYEDDLWGLLDLQAASAAEHFELQQSQLQAAGYLRHLVAAATVCDQPVLSDRAQAFLGCYFLFVRQSVTSTTHVSKPHLLASIMNLATASARLHNRSTVLECPDAALAVVLMEQTLSNKLGDGYNSLLDLPCDLSPGNGRSLDEQLHVLHGVISRTFRQSGLTSSTGDAAECGSFGMDVEEDSGISGCDGGAAGFGKGGVDGPEE